MTPDRDRTRGPGLACRVHVAEGEAQTMNEAAEPVDRAQRFLAKTGLVALLGQLPRQQADATRQKIAEQLAVVALVERFLAESGLTKRLDEADDAEAGRVRGEVETQLQRVMETAPPEETGAPKIVLGRVSLRITGTIWPLARSAVSLAISAHDPTGITWGEAVDAALSTLEALADNIHLLSPDERSICTAISETCRKHKAANLKPEGASRGEIAAYFKQQDEVVPISLDDALLDRLVDRKVLKTEIDAGRGKLYRITF
jgi:hypothetical protein